MIETNRPLQGNDYSHSHHRLSDNIGGNRVSFNPMPGNRRRSHQQGCTKGDANRPIPYFQGAYKVASIASLLRHCRITGQFTVQCLAQTKIQYYEYALKHGIKTNQTVCLYTQKLDIYRDQS